MFFGASPISINILSVLELSWPSVYEKSGHRPFHALSFRRKGSAQMLCDGESAHFTSGELAFVPANYEYTLKAGEETLLVIHFTSVDPLPRQILKFSPQNSQYYERKFQDLLTTWTKKQIGYEYECKSIAYKIIYNIEKETAQDTLYAANDRLTEAIEYIHDNFTSTHLTVDSLASLCGMSDTYFRKLFVQQFSVTPLKYINDLRLTRARELLQSHYFTVSEIAEMCGFNNINYFCMFIKKQTGLSPSELRMCAASDPAEHIP